MAHLPLLIAPDARLRRKSLPVERVDNRIRKLMEDMLETMYASDGIGLAAPQVGEAVRVIVADCAAEGEPRRPLKLANPEIIWRSPESRSYSEGCLSLPDQFADVVRPERVRIRYLDSENEIRETEFDSLTATCLQHEMDHLEGILFVDYLSNLKRDIILRRLAKQRKVTALS